MPYFHMMVWHPFIGFGIHIVGLIAIIAIAYLIYRLIKGEKIFVPKGPVNKSAEDILAERYARGELTKDQYMQMKDDIRGAAAK